VTEVTLGECLIVSYFAGYFFANLMFTGEETIYNNKNEQMFAKGRGV